MLRCAELREAARFGFGFDFDFAFALGLVAFGFFPPRLPAMVFSRAMWRYQPKPRQVYCRKILKETARLSGVMLSPRIQVA